MKKQRSQEVSSRVEIHGLFSKPEAFQALFLECYISQIESFNPGDIGNHLDSAFDRKQSEKLKMLCGVFARLDEILKYS